MIKQHIQVCPVCGSTRISARWVCRDYYATGEEFQLNGCDDCGFRFTQDFPDETEIGRYYDSPEYISHTNTRHGVMNTVYHVVRSLMLRRKARLVLKESRHKTGYLLDIGTGTGYFPYTMQKRGWKVKAVEKNDSARAFAKKHFNFDVGTDALLDTVPDGTFDVITLWHVLEHLQPLNGMWEQFDRLLKQKGTLVIAVPNSDSYDARKYGNEWAAYDVPRHLWHFTPQTIEKLASKHGFVLTASYPMPFDAFYVSMLTEKNLKHRSGLLRGLLSGAKAYAAAWNHPERSSSLIYVFRRK